MHVLKHPSFIWSQTKTSTTTASATATATLNFIWEICSICVLWAGNHGFFKGTLTENTANKNKVNLNIFPLHWHLCYENEHTVRPSVCVCVFAWQYQNKKNNTRDTHQANEREWTRCAWSACPSNRVPNELNWHWKLYTVREYKREKRIM